MAFKQEMKLKKLVKILKDSIKNDIYSYRYFEGDKNE